MSACDFRDAFVHLRSASVCPSGPTFCLRAVGYSPLLNTGCHQCHALDAPVEDHSYIPLYIHTLWPQSISSIQIHSIFNSGIEYYVTSGVPILLCRNVEFQIAYKFTKIVRLYCALQFAIKFCVCDTWFRKDDKRTFLLRLHSQSQQIWL